MSINYDDTIDFMKVSDAPVIRNLQTYTLSVWIKLNSFGGANLGLITSKANLPSALVNLFIQLDNTISGGTSTVYSVQGDSVSYAANNTLSLGVWTHLLTTFSWSGDRIVHIYKNGVEVSYAVSFPATLQYDDTGSPFRVGHGEDITNHYFDGAMAELAIWNTVLSAQEITQVATLGNGIGSVSPLNLIGYWPMCDINNTQDISGQNNPGALFGDPYTDVPSPGRACGQLATGSTTNLVNNDNANVGVTESGVVFKNPNRGQFK